MTFSKQPYLHGPGHYFPVPGEDGERLLPSRTAAAPAVTDPQTASEADTLRDKIEASGVIGTNELERRVAFTRFLALLESSVAQLAPGIVHEYFNKQSLMVAASSNGPRYRIWGDRCMFKHSEGPGRAADAAQLSRRAIADLLERGETDITSRKIFEQFPNRVEQDGTLLTLPEWHDIYLRERCFNEFFGLRSTRIMRILLAVASRSLGMPSVHYAALRAEQRY
jgi:hypothetical protein